MKYASLAWSTYSAQNGDMNQVEIPAAFYRGGTSKGVFFHNKDLPDDKDRKDDAFLQVIGSPDPYGRQLNGMGGGISSLSKIVIISPPSNSHADVDYTFAQVSVDKPIVDYNTNCGNLSSAVGPFAIDEELVKLDKDEGVQTVRLFNTNTKVLVHAHVPVVGGKAAVKGKCQIQGVHGTGSCIRLDYLKPGGATTGRVLPIGEEISMLSITGGKIFEVSIIDAATAMVFVAVKDLHLNVSEHPESVDGNIDLMKCLESIRRFAGVRIGLADSPESVPPTNPKVALLAPPTEFNALDGTHISTNAQDITARVISLNKMHRAIPLTSAMCLAAACGIDGSLPHRLIKKSIIGDIRIGTPSGVLKVGAEVKKVRDNWLVDSTSSYRTARRLMQGSVLIPSFT